MDDRPTVPKKTLFGLVLLLVVSSAVIFGLHTFVSQDDLRNCRKRPAQTPPSGNMDSCVPADAIVVVSGGDTLARTKEAAELYQRGWAQLLIVSGAAQDESGPSNAEVMRSYAIKQGVAPNDLLIDPAAKNTVENAIGTSQLAESRGVRDVIVVTSPYHLPRTKLLFERRFDNVRGHPSKDDGNWSSNWWRTSHGWGLVTSELIKYTLELTRGGNVFKAP